MKNTNIHNLYRFLLIGLLLVCLIIPLSAQQGRGKGRIHGTVVDTDGNPLQDVKIKATHSKFGTVFDAESDKKGSWAMGGLGTGYFVIIAEMEGYNPVHHEMQVSQFSRNNPPIKFTMQKIAVQDMGIPALQDEGAVALFEEGNQLFEEEKYAEAVAKFEEFLLANPMIYQVNINIANCYKEMGEVEKAIAAYSLMLDKLKEEKGSYEGDEGAARALSGIGEAYIKAGELDKAVTYLQQAIDIFPDDETLAFNIGEILFKQGESAKGIEYFKASIEIKDDWPPPYRQMGYAYLNLADYKNAVESFKKFIELAPDDPLTPTIENLIPQLEAMIKK